MCKKSQVLKTETTIEMISAQYTYDVTSTPILLFTGRHTSHGHPRCHCWQGQPKTRWVLDLCYEKPQKIGPFFLFQIWKGIFHSLDLNPSGIPITEMAWNCERFNMEEQPETQNNLSIFPAASTQPRQPQPYLRPDGKFVQVKSTMRSKNLWGRIRI